MEGWLGAAVMALAASSSLLIGALLGVYARASQRVIAAVMAFGSGALIQALAVDLAFEEAERLVNDHQLGALESWLWVAAGFVLGGVAYYEANRWIERGGGHLRSPSRMKAHLFRQAGGSTVRLEALPSVSVYEHGAEWRLMEEQKAKSGGDAPVAIFLGALLDGIPESVVIGASFTTLAAFNPTFLVAVFVSNLPEAMSSAGGMRRAGFNVLRILGLWGGLMVASAIAAALGQLFLRGAVPTLLTLVKAIAGGGILAMLSSTMMPEAFEHGGPSVGLGTIAGFLSAFYFTTLGL